MICPKCDREQPDGLEECLKCGAIFSKIQDSITTNHTSPAKPNPFRLEPIYAVFFLLIMALYAGVYSLGSLAVSSEPPEVSWREMDASLEAAVMMGTFVKERLKAPSTADFKPGYSDSVTRLEGQRYRVISWVDAQNSFGAKLRNHFIGEVEQVERGRWELITLEFSHM